MRTTIDLSDEAYQIAKTVAREQKRSLGRVVSDFITGAMPAAGRVVEANVEDGFPTFRCTRRVTSEDVRELDEEG
jgi:hypothetical protein